MTRPMPLSSNINKNDYTKDPENHLDALENRWFAVYTRYKREKTVKRDLELKGITTFLPIQKVVRNYTRKRKVVELPLISCYIFVHIVKDEYIPVLETDDVVKFVQFSRNLISVSDREIMLLKQIIGEGIPVTAEKTEFRKGDTVEIVAGNLTGLRGILIEEHGTKEMVIDLETMGYSLRLQVDTKLLKKVV